MKEKKKKKCEEKIACNIKTSIGGQALLEGIMMRGPVHSAMAVRRASGEIVIDKWLTSETPTFKPLEGVEAPEKEEKAKPKKEKKKSDKPSGFMRFVKRCAKIPFVRGIFNMGLSLAMGYKCLMRSADVYLADAPEEPIKEPKEGKFIVYTDDNIKPVSVVRRGMKSFKLYISTGKNKPQMSNEAAASLASVLGTVLGLALAVGLFITLPSLIAEYLMKLFGMNPDSSVYGVTVARSAIEGVIKLVVMVGYMWGVSFMKDIRRTFMYHGAEHKTIFCYEAGEELTVENVKKQKRLHPRCGTSFIVLTVLASIIIGMFIPSSLHWGIRSVIKLLLLPLTMGISYELIKFAGKHDNIVTRFFSAPGLWLQKITTVEPDDGMIECAIIALKEVIPEDGSDKI